MKTVTLLLRSAMAVCFAFVMSSASCDLFDKVDDVTLPIELEHTFHVNEQAISNSPVPYSKKEVLDAADVNSDFDKYKAQIKSVTVETITYEVLNYEGDPVTFTGGNIGFSAATGASATSVASLGIENPKAAQGQVKNLDFNQTGLNEIGNLLKNDHEVNLFLMGTFSKTPVKFDVKVKIKANLTADAL